MKCPKCNGDKGQWDIGNYHWYPCDFCHETGEVVGNSEQLKSRSVQRREALQKGEPMPTVKKSLTVEDKPVILPPGDPGRCSDCGCDLDKPAGEDCNVRHEDKPKMPGQITSEFGELNAKFIQEAERMLVRCKELQIHLDCANQLLKTQREEYDKLKANHLPADKVREAIKKAIEMDIAQGFWLSTPTTYADYDIRKKDYQLKKKQFANIIISLFPEGVGEQKGKV